MNIYFSTTIAKADKSINFFLPSKKTVNTASENHAKDLSFVNTKK